MSNRTVFGITRTQEEAQSIVGAFMAANFDREKILVHVPDQAKTETTAVGGLAGFDIPENHAEKFETLVRGGGILVAAHCGSAEEQLKASQIFARGGATDIVSWTLPSTKSTRSTSAERNYDRERETGPAAVSRR